VSESKHTPDIWGEAVRDFLAQYDNRRGRGGFPTAMDRAAIKRVLEQRSGLLEALRAARQTVLDLKNSRWSEVEGSDEEWVAEIDAAIAKATGQ